MKKHGMMGRGEAEVDLEKILNYKEGIINHVQICNDNHITPQDELTDVYIYVYPIFKKVF